MDIERANEVDEGWVRKSEAWCVYVCVCVRAGARLAEFRANVEVRVWVCVRARVRACGYMLKAVLIQQDENKSEHGYMVHLSWQSCYTIPARLKTHHGGNRIETTQPTGY